MLSESSFSDRAITEEFYTALFDRFYNSFLPSIQVLLNQCTYGVAPDRSGVRTLFLIAANPQIATDLKDRIEILVDRIAEVMPGIGKAAICFLPADKAANAQSHGNCNVPPSKFMMGQVFRVSQQSEASEL
ncbi:hypothetical protein IQ235_07560 [Oscillatoriales cyanobacterium LEGE 11467]|uniref:Uncharacterized protein n=1 Tax=Zarconia navalis LEGE 11467 TaxID=1828826 RepID=A0A928VYJ3_9CYAN|nr:hypothetical protein [Zarconia navalis]MBE9040636.1 hypothetical protein [Zarconia navalis LEGE 11467]